MNKFIIAFFGWIVYTWLVLVVDKDKYDEQDKIWPVREWFQKNWDNVLLSFLGVCLLGVLPLLGVNLESEMIERANTLTGLSLKWNDGLYVFGGFIFEFILRLYKLYKNKKAA